MQFLVHTFHFLVCLLIPIVLPWRMHSGQSHTGWSWLLTSLIDRAHGRGPLPAMHAARTPRACVGGARKDYHAGSVARNILESGTICIVYGGDQPTYHIHCIHTTQTCGASSVSSQLNEHVSNMHYVYAFLLWPMRVGYKGGWSGRKCFAIRTNIAAKFKHWKRSSTN